MSNPDKQISNPFSTGGGGQNFENQVQASFVAMLLTGGFAPCLPCRPIHKIKLQGHYAGFNTDDMVVFTANKDGSDEQKLLCQIKHKISITKGNGTFGEVISAAWRDFNNPQVFTKGKDQIALITGPLSAKDIANVRTLLEWTRSSETAVEFLTKVEKAIFSSNAKRTKLAAIRSHLNTAHGESLPDDDLVEFLRHFHLLGYDLDIRSGVMHAILHSIIGQNSRNDAASIWNSLVREVSSFNQSAGTITRESLPDDLRNAFTNPEPQQMPRALSREIAPRDVHSWQTSEFASVLTVVNLLGAWDENSDADMAIVEKLVDGDRSTWISSLREILQISGCPVRYRNGVWSIKNRVDLWDDLGLCVFDEHLVKLRNCTKIVLEERDPQFKMSAENRLCAAIHGMVYKHSSHLRIGLAESLALLGNRPDKLGNCSREMRETVALLVVRDVLNGADWIGWGSVNDLLPLIAEADPNEFLANTEQALAATPCPFDALLAQERGGIGGGNYLTGLLWALETIAWDDEFLVRAVVALGALAEHDPGGSWSNRPFNSLTTILLPWLPQTTAPMNKQEIAVNTLLQESPGTAWKLLMNLLPKQTSVSSGSRKPVWRNTISDDWEESPTNKEYWDQLGVYAKMVVDVALKNEDRLIQLIEHLDTLPEPELKRVLQHISSENFSDVSQGVKTWQSLTDLARRHRRFAHTEWAFSNEVISEIESAAVKIEPKEAKNLYRTLFSGRDWDLYEENGNRREQERELDDRRQKIIDAMLISGGIDEVMEFAEIVESPRQVGFSLGCLDRHDVSDRILPDLLVSDSIKLMEFAAMFVYSKYRHDGPEWADSIDIIGWPKLQIAQFLNCLPFTNETWKRANKYLDHDVEVYWKKVEVKPHQAEDGLLDAIDMLLENGRPQAAIDCLVSMVYNEDPLDEKQTIKALLDAVTSSEPIYGNQSYYTAKIITTLQNDPATNLKDLQGVEWAYLPLLNENNDAAPKTLERHLAFDPAFFCELIRMIYRSKNEPIPDVEPSDKQKTMAKNAHLLLHDWQIPPGTSTSTEFGGEAFMEWIDAVKQSTEESGHLTVALHTAGGVLIHCPSDPEDGLCMHRSVAEILNRQDMMELRRGYSIAVYNSRGVHWVDPTGNPEHKLANIYRDQAEEIENAGYHRVAAMLRGIGETYESEELGILDRHSSE